MKKLYPLYFLLILFICGCSSTSQVQRDDRSTDYQSAAVQDWLNLDTVTAGKFDTGTMWTFEYFPSDYLKETYNFTPTEEWITNARSASLRFANYCSASFISASGLVMTNNHCAREAIVEVTEEGENLSQDGFLAASLEEERRVPSLYVDQLVLIRDVTDEVLKQIDEGREVRVITSEISAREEEATGLIINVTPLFNGGRYSLYGYKRYEDVRLVFTPEHLLGHFGGEYDNFTYPRYSLDCAFFRVYDDEGNPLNTENYFPWSSASVTENELVFVIGNPGSTNRLNSVSQLEFARDILYPRTLDVYNSLLNAYTSALDDNEEIRQELEVQILQFQNAIKAFTGMLGGLRNPVLMQRKRDFENKVKQSVNDDPQLRNNYGDVWNQLDEINHEKRGISNQLYALSLNPLRSPQMFFTAIETVELGRQLQIAEEDRDEIYRGAELDTTINNLIPTEINREMQRELLELQLRQMVNYLGKDDNLVRALTNGRNPSDAADYLMNNSVTANPEQLRMLINSGGDAILNSDDPFIYFVLNSEDRRTVLQRRSSELSRRESENAIKLGRAIFDVYGTSIPPDATFTLRISDGIVTGFPYNGTVAPPVTTFYGMYDRYYSFNKEYPWDLPEKWLNPPAEFNMAASYNFVSTNDIVGGNSGSPVINRNGEVVGLAFDGNIQSLPGSFIYTTEDNRAVSVSSEGMIEVLRHIYGAEALSEEIVSGRIN
jgi:hypothetical protein